MMDKVYEKQCYYCTKEGYWNCKLEKNEDGECKNFTTSPQIIRSE